jgi:hypothetical protein
MKLTVKQLRTLIREQIETELNESVLDRAKEFINRMIHGEQPTPEQLETIKAALEWQPNYDALGVENGEALHGGNNLHLNSEIQALRAKHRK